jgi:hypothetical protein
MSNDSGLFSGGMTFDTASSLPNLDRNIAPLRTFRKLVCVGSQVTALPSA